MARQVLPFVGLVVGSFFGAPQLGFMIGTLVGNAVDPQQINGPKIGDAGLQTSAEGIPRPVVFGTAPVAGNVIDRGNRQVRKQRESQGKGGGPEVVTERVYWTFAIRLCEGPIAGVTRIWMDEKLVYDIRPGSTIPEESDEFADRFRLYLGDEEQLPDPDLEAFRGVGNVPAYRGTAYVVFPNYDLTDRRESIPNFRFEVCSLLQTEQVSTVLSSGEVASGGYRTSRSVDGTSWDPTHAAPGIIRLLGGANGRFIGYRELEAFYSDDYGETWTPANTDVFTGIGIASGRAKGTTVILAAGLDGLYRSADNGLTYGRVDTPGIFVNYFGWVGSGIVAVSLYSASAFFSADLGATWEVVGFHGLAAGRIGGGYEGVGCVMFAGVADGLAAVSITTDMGDTFEVVTIPGETDVDPTALYCRISGQSETWIMGLENGHVYRSTDRHFWLLVDDIGEPVTTITHNGERFLLGGGATGGGVTRESVNGIDWNDSGSPLTYSVTSIASQPPLPPEALSEPVPLSQIVTAIHRRVRQDASLYDVGELDDMVDGIVFAGDFTCAEAIRSLMPAYFFDAPEFDDGSSYAIRYVKRGKPVVAVITDDDLIEAPEKTVREDALERPRTLHLSYQSPTVGYAPAKATVTRDSPDVQVVGEVSLQLPVCFSDVTEPRQIAHKLHKIAWVEVAGEEEFVLGDNWLELVPGDCIGVSLRGQVRRMRVVQEQADGGEQRYRLIADRQSAYTSAITGIPLPEPTPPPPSIVGLTVFEFLDIPALNDGNDRLLYYVAASGQTEAWYGALVQRQILPDTTWSDATAFSSLNTVMGTLLNDVSDASEHYTDTTNSVRVQLFSDDDIEAITEQQFLSEGGAFALEKDDGTWELLQYRDADDEGDGIFVLSHLARGRLNSGTEAHTAGARFVLLDAVHSVDAMTAWLGSELTHRAVSLGTSPETAATYTDPYIGRSQIEFPVAHLFVERAGDTITANTVPRHRFGTELNPVRSINWIGYRWTVTDGANSITRDSTNATESFDVTGWASPVSVSVAQLNRITGAGPTVTEDIA